MRDIYIKDPDGDYDYDGEEDTEDLEEAFQRDWEINTLNW